MRGGVIGRLADVDEDRLLAIDQPHCIGSGNLRAATGTAQQRPGEQAARDEGHGEQVPVLDHEIQGRRSAEASARRKREL
jgi:hypothetical protein